MGHAPNTCYKSTTDLRGNLKIRKVIEATINLYREALAIVFHRLSRCKHNDFATTPKTILKQNEL
jgi:hypothetical protein